MPLGTLLWDLRKTQNDKSDTPDSLIPLINMKFRGVYGILIGYMCLVTFLLNLPGSWIDVLYFTRTACWQDVAIPLQGHDAWN